MKTWIALIRGINVGGHQIVPMKRLATLLESAGCRDVKTYIQSGNVVFRSSISAASGVEARIRKAMSDGFGFEPRILVLDRGGLRRAMAANPFPGATTNPKTLHLFFLERRPRDPDIDAITRLKARGEEFALDGAVFYLHAPAGLGTSKLAERLERHLGVDATARNWRTVSAVMDLAESCD